VTASAGQAVNHLDERYGGEMPDILDHGYVLIDFVDVPDIFRATGALTLLLAGVSLMLDRWLASDGANS
jgi:hypothetical protein